MKRFFLTILALVIITWIVDANRDMMQTLRAVFTDVGNELTARSTLQQLARIVRNHYRETRTLPSGNLAEFVVEYKRVRERQADSKLLVDVWGTAYRLVPARTGFFVVSAGPDRNWDTRDDIRVFQSLEDLGFPRSAQTPPGRR